MYTIMTNGCVLRDDGAYIPNDPSNGDWKIYQAWLAAGNTAAPSPASSATALWAAYQVTASDALDRSDITILRCAEHGVVVPQEWRDYRTSLRAIIAATSGTPGTLPVRPAFPVGT
jgi:hypothetical protein